MANNIPEIYVESSNKFFDSRDSLSSFIYPFLNVYCKRTSGALIVIPLIRKISAKIYKGLSLSDGVEGYILIWSPVKELLPISNTRTVLFVMNNNLKETFNKTITLNGHMPLELVESYEAIMEERGFFTGLSCALLVKNMELQVLPTSTILDLLNNK